MSEVSDSVKYMSEIIAKHLEWNKESSTIQGDKDAFNDCIKDNPHYPDVTLKAVKEVNNCQTDFVAAGAHAFGVMAIKHLKSDHNLSQITGEIPMQGRSKAEYSMDRERTFENRLGNGEKVVKHGVLKASFHGRAGRNIGDLSAIRNELNEMAAKALK